jgi:alpha-D-xyloside xylohydrolase
MRRLPRSPTRRLYPSATDWAPPPSFCVDEALGIATVTTARMKAKVNETTGVVTFTDTNDAVILAEDSKRLTPTTVEGVNTLSVQTVFNSPANEALFGLGQHQDSVMNLKGATQHIENANTQINLPLLVSNRGYGVFWDNYSRSDFFGNDTGNTKYRYVSEAGELVDYYFLLWSQHRSGDRAVPYGHRRSADVSEMGLWALSVQGPLHEHG